MSRNENNDLIEQILAEGERQQDAELTAQARFDKWYDWCIAAASFALLIMVPILIGKLVYDSYH